MYGTINPSFISDVSQLIFIELKTVEYVLYYSMFHVTRNTFKFNRNRLGTVSAYVMRSVPWSNQRVHYRGFQNFVKIAGSRHIKF